MNIAVTSAIVSTIVQSTPKLSMILSNTNNKTILFIIRTKGLALLNVA